MQIYLQKCTQIVMFVRILEALGGQKSSLAYLRYIWRIPLYLCPPVLRQRVTADYMLCGGAID